MTDNTMDAGGSAPSGSIFDLYEVGGCVRDDLLGKKSKDIDFAVVCKARPIGDEQPYLCITGRGNMAEGEFQCERCSACIAYTAMNDWMSADGFRIYQPRPAFMTTRAQFPRTHVCAGIDADFVLARTEGPYTDGRRPDWVAPGTLFQDQSRRDLTINSMARSESGEIIDPFNGRGDLANRLLRCVGTPRERLTEDALRALRAIRFSITMDFELEFMLRDALQSSWLPPLVAAIPDDRIRGELDRCFKHSTVRTLDVLCHGISRELFETLFDGNLRLAPTMKG